MSVDFDLFNRQYQLDSRGQLYKALLQSTAEASTSERRQFGTLN